MSSSWEESRRCTAVNTRTKEAALLVRKIKPLHVAHKRNYGAIRVHKALRKQGLSCSRRRTNRLMKAHGIRSTYHAYKAGRRPGGYAEIADNLLAKTPQATAAGQQ